MLKHKYLTPYTHDRNIATGILYGSYARPLICLPVASLKHQEYLGIHFLIDTSSPATYLSDEALKTLFKNKDSSVNVNIWGVKLAVNRSLNHFEGINILGANYLQKANIKF